MPEQKKQTKNIPRKKKVLFVGYRFMITLSLYLFLYSFTIRSFYTPGQRKSRRVTLLTVIFRASNKKKCPERRVGEQTKIKYKKCNAKSTF